MDDPTSELIVSTYNAPRALALSLASLPGQVRRPASVCIADDGSGAETAEVIGAFRARHPDLPVRHVWHEDQGFRKTVILNRAVATSEADYLIFTDGDCLLSPGFIARHLRLARAGRYLCGSLVRLPMAATRAVTEMDVTSGRVFAADWLSQAGALRSWTTRLKAGIGPVALRAALEVVYPIRRTWSGSNASAFREAMLAVNGFDERMEWGGEDKEFGVRLGNSGLRGRHLRFTAPVVHLDHARGYVDAEKVARQRGMIRAARHEGRVWTEAGIAAGPRG